MSVKELVTNFDVNVIDNVIKEIMSSTYVSSQEINNATNTTQEDWNNKKNKLFDYIKTHNASMNKTVGHNNCSTNFHLVNGDTNKVTNDTTKDTTVSTEDDECLICFDSLIDKKDIIILPCKHMYCYDCILSAYINNKANKSCPYCRKYGGYLPLPLNHTPIKGIHKEYVSGYKSSLNYAISHYTKPQLINIAKKHNIPIVKTVTTSKGTKEVKKLKQELYDEIKKYLKKKTGIKKTIVV